MSNRFARVTEEVLLRHKELAVEHHKTKKLGRSALETLFLYIVILLYSWESGVLEKKKFPKLCEIFELDIDNSYRRLKIMRQKGWIEDTKEFIRPLRIHRSKTVTITDDSKNKTVTVTPKSSEETVTITDKNCNSYSKTNENTVTVTVENAKSPIPASDSSDAKTFLNLKETDLTTSSDSEKNLSQFSLEECLRYVEIRRARGERLETPHRLARWLHQTGNDDVFIRATLYPEPAEQSAPTAYDINDDDQFFADALHILRDVRELDGDVSGFEKYYEPDIWRRLMGELER